MILPAAATDTIRRVPMVFEEIRMICRAKPWKGKKRQTQGGKRKQIKKRTMRQRQTQTQTGQQLRHFIVAKTLWCRS